MKWLLTKYTKEVVLFRLTQFNAIIVAISAYYNLTSPAAYDDDVWAFCMETGGAVMALKVQLVIIADANKTPPSATRNSNSLAYVFSCLHVALRAGSCVSSPFSNARQF